MNKQYSFWIISLMILCFGISLYTYIPFWGKMGDSENLEQLMNYAEEFSKANIALIFAIGTLIYSIYTFSGKKSDHDLKKQSLELAREIITFGLANLFLLQISLSPIHNMLLNEFITFIVISMFLWAVVVILILVIYRCGIFIGSLRSRL